MPRKPFNAWARTGKRDTGYRGINTTLKSPDGQILELQFHTSASLELKMRVHPLYEQMRRLPYRSEPWERLRDMQINEAKRVPLPPGAPGL